MYDLVLTSLWVSQCTDIGILNLRNIFLIRYAMQAFKLKLPAKEYRMTF